MARRVRASAARSTSKKGPVERRVIVPEPARAQFLHLASVAPTESARDYWRRRAEGVPARTRTA